MYIYIECKEMFYLFVRNEFKSEFVNVNFGYT